MNFLNGFRGKITCLAALKRRLESVQTGRYGFDDCSCLQAALRFLLGDAGQQTERESAICHPMCHSMSHLALDALHALATDLRTDLEQPSLHTALRALRLLQSWGIVCSNEQDMSLCEQ